MANLVDDFQASSGAPGLGPLGQIRPFGSKNLFGDLVAQFNAIFSLIMTVNAAVKVLLVGAANISRAIQVVDKAIQTNVKQFGETFGFGKGITLEAISLSSMQERFDDAATTLMQKNSTLTEAITFVTTLQTYLARITALVNYIQTIQGMFNILYSLIPGADKLLREALEDAKSATSLNITPYLELANSLYSSYNEVYGAYNAVCNSFAMFEVFASSFNYTDFKALNPPSPTNAPVPQTRTFSLASEFPTDPKNVRTGVTWTPFGKGTGLIEVFLPADIDATSVNLYSPNKDVTGNHILLDDGKYAGISPDKRERWTFNIPVATIPAESFLKVFYTVGTTEKTVKYAISDPSITYTV